MGSFSPPIQRSWGIFMVKVPGGEEKKGGVFPVNQLAGFYLTSILCGEN